ncbi:MAG: chromosome segregation protein SMC [Planctomycetota bacterium]|nr:MAG: chromosome segregation protein SMC [Planctomycetota bacterium]
MTRLKALELFGFKSFADRTRFEFPDGITVVVGPNGSGKSNVVDAIKWVLGEQSVRSLRGRDMTDVIFAGSVSRKPLNTAETTLVFDNTARKLPVENDEVQIGRRVYRSGENEYLINGEVCRLRDIRDLFSGTGAATEAYSVIEQGRVDALLVASGKDRRAVFEEAAGITRFKARRTEALRRLERAEQNRQRLADIVGEVAGRLETVRHQAARARRWRQMTDRLRCLRLLAAREDLAQVDAAVADVEALLSGLQGELAAADQEATTATVRAADLLRESHELGPQLAALRSRVSTERELAAATEARRGLLLQRGGEWEAEVARICAEARSAGEKARAAVSAADEAASLSTAVGLELAALETRLADRERARAGSHEDVAEARMELAALGKQLERLTTDQQRLVLEADRASSRHEEASRAASEWRQRIDTARHQVDAVAEAAAARDGNVSALVFRLDATSSEIASAETAVRDHSAALENTWRDLAGWQAKLEACRERKGLLEEFANRHEGLGEAARRILADAAAAGSSAPLCGVVADLIEAPLEWAGLVDIVLGASSQSLAVQSLDDFASWLSEWSASPAGIAGLANGGRVGIVADALLPDPSPVDLTAVPGVVGRLDRLLGGTLSEEGGQPAIVCRLLGHAWVVESFEIARRLASQSHPGVIFITRDGQCATAGRLEVGTASGPAGLVARRAELKSLGERSSALERQAEATAAAVAVLQSDLASAGQTVRQLQARRQHEAEGVAAAKADASRLLREHASARESLSAAEAAMLAADRRTTEAARGLEGLSDQLERCQAALAETRRDLERTQDSIAAIEGSRGSLMEEIHHLRIDLAAGRERLTRIQHDALARSAEAVQKRDDLRAVHDRADATRQRFADAELELLHAGSALAEAAWATEQSEIAFAELSRRRDAVESQRTAATVQAEVARSAASELGERIHGGELEAGEARHRRVRIVERIRDEYDIDIEAVESLALDAEPAAMPGDELPSDRAGVDSAIEELKRKLASMTTVNLEALAESEQLAERLAGLEAQFADVTSAKASIEQLIARIDDESRRLLADTIETVRGHFRELFERVFGGGQADIVLESGVDILDAAVEIVARPPGKEPRSISLLSGGEKTMTCVALLLAIFRSRPSPFCVLDEVDAALDEANVDRFVGVLREFKNTQIIVVTHSKKTMAAANTLYGVTMEESGVSKRVSVRFEAAAAAVLPLPRSAAA